MAQASHLSRYRPAVLSVATIAAAYGIYTLYSAYSNNHATSTSLRRSNAVHRPRRDRERERHAVGIDRLPPTHDAPLGLIILRKGEDAYVINLATTMFPTTDELQRIYQPPVNEEIRQKIAVVAVELILLSCLNSTTEPDSWDQFRALGFAELVHAMAGRDRNEIRGLAQQIPDILQMSGITEQQVAQALNKFFVSEKWLAAIREAGDTEPAETEDMDRDDGASKEPSHGLRGLLYYIAEEDAKRKAYEHRGIRCEECSEMPIRGIRYHCLNCPDYDLCASCEQHTEHVKTHVFAKIKIPLPILSQPTKEYRLWYPGDPRKIHESLEPALRKRLCHEYGYEEPDIDALYDQFMANANVPFPHATTSVKACIDRRAFNKALTRDTWTTCFASNTIYDRMYALYDTDMNGVIDFEEFVSGVSYLRGPKRFATLARAIRGYDMDGNGFVDRSDFTRLLRAKYEIQQQLVSDMVEGQEIEQTQAALETLQSSQPISSVFSQEDIPPGEIRERRGKREDMNGDLQPNEGTKTILENDHPWPGTSPPTREAERRTVSRFAEMIYGPFDGTSPSFEGVELDDIDGLPRWDHTGRDDDDDPHIPDIIWQTVEDGLNELLDKMFKAKEEENTATEETRAMRQKWSKQIADAREEERRRKNAMIESAQSDPLVATAVIAGLDSKPKSPPRQHGAPHMRRQMVPTDTESLERREREISAAPLEELLDTTGFSVRDASSSVNVSSLPRAAHIGASSIWNGSVRSQATSPLRTMISTDDEETVDPTLPQNRPNAIDTSVPTSPPVRKENRKPPALPERPPSHEELRYLADLDDAEQQSLDRGGPGRLSYAELEAMAVADTKGELRGLIKSWLEYASF
ncbi:hypothetical protein M409DRAFT_62933 [Zasmidium cellare ATCC 36951]|uniref:EF-hand n=1 Tax=Zasmidium cellare ATCC 36951 TaxID=1080233 RepID=A0A6A6D167_ZASCE|nr:uncharacterized protein M409DRAFT_62933 [Zasmidium cellare ATCC 36951]KAF2172158.1 hypothetical protein M409DRAFT_62933 [Zasmidium cellare ATCC 36951]